MKVLIVDPGIAGIAGDMLIASLVDLSGESGVLHQLAEAITRAGICGKFELAVMPTDAHGLKATCLDIRIGEQGIRSPAVLRQDGDRLSDDLGISTAGRERIGRVLGDLIAAHDRLHPSGFSRHSIASADTLFDVVGSILLLEQGGFFSGRIYGLAPVLGRGIVKTDGGEVAGPAPATLEILCRNCMPYRSIPVPGELTTPTGAALLAHISHRIVDCYPPLTPARTGYGAGTRRVEGHSGVLRVIEGRNSSLVQDHVIMLETNLDDISGEEIGYATERLFEEGAVDVFVTPAYGKKNRPVQVISVICDPLHAPALTATLMDETGTLGVRVSEIPRLVADRSRIPVPMEIGGRIFTIRVKTSTANGRLINVKPEYEDLRKAAKELDMPLREVAAEVKRQLVSAGALRHTG